MSSFNEHSQLISKVATYIKKEAKSKNPYSDNILVDKQANLHLDSASPVQKNYHDGGKYYGTFYGGLRHGFGKYYFGNGDIYEG